MTKKDFFILTFKLFVLYLLLTTVFYTILSNMLLAVVSPFASSILWMMVLGIATAGLLALLLFNARKIVKALELDKGFDEDRIELGNLTATEIIKIATFIVGGLLIINNIPDFIAHLFAVIAGNSGDTFNLVVSAIKLIVGYWLVTNYDFVAKRISKKTKDKTVG